MTMRQDEYWDAVKTACEQSLAALAQRVVNTWPHIRFRSGSYSNPAFPARFWGSFTNSLRNDEESVDISIDFRWADHVIEVMADVAYESGKVLSALPVQSIPLKSDGSFLESIAQKVVTRISKYVQEQWELIGEVLLT